MTNFQMIQGIIEIIILGVTLYYFIKEVKREFFGGWIQETLKDTAKKRIKSCRYCGRTYFIFDKF